MNLDQKLNSFMNSDIACHLTYMSELANGCDHITEFGTRSIVSTWAWLRGKPKKIICYDIKDPNEYTPGVKEEFISACKNNGVEFVFNKESTIETETIESTDLLFIDTLHTYDQVSKELELHAHKTNKYLCGHDSELKEVRDAFEDYVKDKNFKKIYDEPCSHGFICYKKMN